MLRNRLLDLGELRLREMDEAGIDVQVLSHGAPATQRMDAETAVPVAREANDRLLEVDADTSNGRFEGFAVAAHRRSEARAADELERAVTKLGFKGAMMHGLSNGQMFLDDKRFWPIFERAQALDVPIYLHPAVPHPAVIEVYYKDYLKEFPGLLTAAWGFTVETATQAHPHGALGHVRGVSAAEDHPRPPGRGRCPSRCGASTWRCTPGQPRHAVPRHVPRALLDHHQRQLLDRRRCCAR